MKYWVITVLLVGYCLLGHAQSGDTRKIDVGTVVFPSKPTNYPSILPDIGRPGIVLPNTWTNIGKPEQTNMMEETVEDLLQQSGRFRVHQSVVPNADYTCLVSITDIQIHQLQHHWGGLGVFTNLMHLNINGQPANADLSKDKLQMTVDCAVSVHLLDKSNIVAAAGEGKIEKTDSTANMKLDFSGSDLENTNSSSQIADLGAGLVKAAVSQALTNLVCQFDDWESNLNATATAAAAKPTVEDPTNFLANLKEIIDARNNQMLDTNAAADNIGTEVTNFLRPFLANTNANFHTKLPAMYALKSAEASNYITAAEFTIFMQPLTHPRPGTPIKSAMK